MSIFNICLWSLFIAGYFECKLVSNGHFMFNLRAGNHEVLLTSELYTTKAACTGGIESVRKNASVDTNFTRKVAKDGSDYFVLVASNHQTIGKERDLLVGRGHGKRHRLCKGERAERDRQRPLLLGLVHTE